MNKYEGLQIVESTFKQRMDLSPRYQNILQSHRNRRSCGLREEQVNSPMEENRVLRDRPHIYRNLMYDKHSTVDQWESFH